MRAKTNCHRRDIISGDYSHNLGLIATGGRDHTVRIWEYEKMKFREEILAHREEVSIVKFLYPLRLLMTADSKGVMYIWLIDPLDSDGRKCIARLENDNAYESDAPISAVDSYYNEETGEFLLLIGDEKGKVKIQDISVIPRTYNLKPVDLSKDVKRNPHFKIDKMDQDAGADDDDGQSDDGE